jgi:hypothetical protein
LALREKGYLLNTFEPWQNGNGRDTIVEGEIILDALRDIPFFFLFFLAGTKPGP